MPDSQEAVLNLIYGRWRSQIMYTGVSLGIFEAVGDEPRSVAQIAGELNLDPALSYRLMRALGSIGLLREQSGARFSVTGSGRFLRGDHPQTLRGATLLVEGPEHYALWKHLPAMIRDGKQDAFMREYGEAAFAYASHTPAYAEAFDAGMSSYSRMQAVWALDALKDYDFSNVKRLCDVGGGQGYLLCQFLLKYPQLAGTVLERPSVIENSSALWAQKLGLKDRCEYVGGDMFADVPVADAYL
jgi:O-methyltransferase domain/Dimerisation domain